TLQVEEKVNQVTEKIVIVEEKSVIEDKVTTVVTTEVIKEEIKTVKTEIDDESGAPVVRNAEMVGITPGFYLIANVFGNPNNADAFLAKLKSLGLDADYFINPQNNYRYVYVAHLSTYQEAKDLFQNKLGGKYPDEMWILKMNMN
ncbi:MAG TPA: SPOR domain-containing protein, partial [Flavobacteriaceae bacterium]|nr:SPOR domain-containing protein [Flavobacteriaceae bacterium]